MAALFAGIINSQQFEFVIGANVEEKPTVFSIHSEVIASLSKPLESMMGDKWLEGENRRAEWEDVSKQTFEQFVQFAYTGDYSIEEPEDAPSQTESKHEPLQEFRSKKQKMKKASSKWLFVDKPPAAEPSVKEPLDGFTPHRPLPQLTETFDQLSYNLLAPRNKYGSHDPPAKLSVNKTYGKIILSHVTLYIFADFWGVESLKALALFKLHKTLCVYDIHHGDVGNIIDLARTAYTDEGRGSDGTGEDGNIGKLRDMVCRFMAKNMATLLCENKFQELVQEGGDFACDMLKYVYQTKD